MFSLDSRLANDTITLGDFPLCRCLLMNDAQYPWLILVPRRENLREVHELSSAEQAQLLRESSWLSQTLQQAFNADKMNVANLGNVVAQLHWHIVARHSEDAAWPGPIWGKHPAQRYSTEALSKRLEQLHALLDRADDAIAFTPT
ncbi:MAG: HIT domain-containing protein [Paraperlucidibaca sp.]